MKKLLLSIIFVLLVLTTFSSCKSDSQTEDANNVAIGIIETTGYKSKSYIHFFDKDLKFLYKKVFNYASLSEPFDRPICENGDVKIAPFGDISCTHFVENILERCYFTFTLAAACPIIYCNKNHRLNDSYPPLIYGIA